MRESCKIRFVPVVLGGPGPRQVDGALSLCPVEMARRQSLLTSNFPALYPLRHKREPRVKVSGEAKTPTLGCGSEGQLLCEVSVSSLVYQHDQFLAIDRAEACS